MSIKLNNVFSVCGVIGMTLIPSAWGNQISTLSSWGPYQTGEGGEVTMKLGSGMTSYAQYYNSSTLNQMSGTSQQPNIQTFCAEYPEHIWANTTYDVDLSNQSKFVGHQLTVGAAYLYYNFAGGSLAGYNYSGTTDSRRTSADLLQRAIWYFMGDLPVDSSNPFLKLAQNNGYGSLTDYNNGRFGVQVINIWALGHLNESGYERQDFLIRVSNSQPSSQGPAVPDGGTTLGLLGIAVAGLSSLGRRFRR